MTDHDRSNDGTWKRRRLLKSTGAVALGVGVAGCTVDRYSPTERDETATTVPGTETPPETEPPGTETTDPPGTGTPVGSEGEFTGMAEAEAVEVSVETVERTREPPDEPAPVPEAGPVSEEKLEELKTAARRGELQQPPASAVQREDPPEEALAGGTGGDSAGRQSISIGTEFPGWNSTNSGGPPADPDLAVGPEKAVMAVNTRWGIFDKGSGSMQYEVSLYDWFGSLIDKREAMLFDPKVLYDHQADRFVLVCLGFNAPDSYMLVAVSDDADPFGTWWITRIGHGDKDNWLDYPCLGIGSKGIYITANLDPWPVDTDIEFQYSRLVIIDKSALYNGGGYTYWWFNGLQNPDGTDAYTVQPAQMLGPSDATYMVNSNPMFGDSLTLWEVTNPTSRPRVKADAVPTSTYALPPEAKQPAGNDLETWDARLMNAVYSAGSVWTAHAIVYDWEDDDDAESIIKWYEISTFGNFVAQTRGWGRPNGYYMFPVVAAAPDGGMMMVYDESGTNTPPRMEVAGRTRGHTKDALEDAAVVKRGRSGYDLYSRWGDYNGMVLDPSSGRYWAHSQYASNPNDTDTYQSWAAETWF